mmetsp:Transcript_25759/g.71954  ORF Transcript_25759/g.71954 Transcript_25759/m.71954 type:complete len:209 (-) Transcript_25759:137-763(-)
MIVFLIIERWTARLEEELAVGVDVRVRDQHLILNPVAAPGRRFHEGEEGQQPRRQLDDSDRPIVGTQTSAEDADCVKERVSVLCGGRLVGIVDQVIVLFGQRLLAHHGVADQQGGRANPRTLQGMLALTDRPLVEQVAKGSVGSGKPRVFLGNARSVAALLIVRVFALGVVVIVLSAFLERRHLVRQQRRIFLRRSIVLVHVCVLGLY